MKKKILFAVITCLLVVAAFSACNSAKPNGSEKSAVTSEKTSSESEESEVSSENTNDETSAISENSTPSEPITDVETIKSLLDNCIEENGYKLGVNVEIQDSKYWILGEPDHEIVIVGLSVDYNRRSEIENWDAYLGEISDKVLECISDNNIDENYVIVYLYE